MWVSTTPERSPKFRPFGLGSGAPARKNPFVTHAQTQSSEPTLKSSPAGRPASLVRRAGARILDFGVCGAALAALPWWVAVLVAVAWLVVPVWLGGATAGKWLFRIRVARVYGAPVTPGRAFVREAFVLGSFVIPLIAVLNAMVVVNDPRRQGFQDKIVDSVVVDRD